MLRLQCDIGHLSEYGVASTSCFSLLSITFPISLMSGGSFGGNGSMRL
jgi:hypothetical protein